MALSIKNPEVERLAAEVARLAGETRTQAVRQALVERLARLRARLDRGGDLDATLRILETEIWSRLPADQRGRGPTKAEREEILGYGPDGF